ncbi:hypothetical protein G4G28_21495 [Massilia sp. Dwa41.01b]|uniref:hypothetical protein n=1 Tax=unclassified Massilia TaxID=2609279 RepID=UPI0016017D33|nr:hypothetical protein [Massilia sp. Se16.2.3]QNA90424.1 hypothetical protein G4G28_21495 [Massilia sp. Dwa41.01b]QNA97653.1 hypothetical protein G4G31_00575 [Massilia sp. Se16.2.3]
MPKLLRYAALAIALIAALMWMKHENDAKACREAGGNWDSEANTCVRPPATPGRTPV